MVYATKISPLTGLGLRLHGEPCPVIQVQRQILCCGGTAGTGQRSDVAAEGHECAESELAKAECRKGRQGTFAAIVAGLAGGELTILLDKPFHAAEP